MPSQKLLELSVATKRKLLNVNHDLRTERQQKNPDAQRISTLKGMSKRLDRAYSACLHCAKGIDAVQLDRDYKTLLELYKKS